MPSSPSSPPGKTFGGNPPPEGVGYPVTLTFPSHKAAKFVSIVTQGGFEADMPRDVVCEIKEDLPGAAAADLFVYDPQHPGAGWIHTV